MAFACRFYFIAIRYCLDWLIYTYPICKNTRGRKLKLYKKSCSMPVRSTGRPTFLVNVLLMFGIIYLQVLISAHLSSFQRTVKLIDMSAF